MPLASIPSPGHAAWRLGPLPLRAYALCVAAGIIVAMAVASRRYRRNGGRPGAMLDVAAWAVPFGLAIGVLGSWWTQQLYGPPSPWWFMLCAAAYAAGSFWVEWVRIRPLPQVLGIRYGAAGDMVVFALAVVGLYLTRPRRTPPARTYAKAKPRALVEDSSGDVMSR